MKFCYDRDRILILLFVGDALQIPELVNATVKVLAENIDKLSNYIFDRFIQCDSYSFFNIFKQKILKKGLSLFFPICFNDDFGSIEGVAELNRSDEKMFSARFSPCGNFIVASTDDEVLFLKQDENGDWNCVATLEWDADDRFISSVEISQDGKQIVAACGDEKVRIWEQDENLNWGCVATLEWQTSLICSASISSDGKHIVATASDCEYARVWGRDEFGNWEFVQMLGRDSDFISDCISEAKFSKDGKKIITASVNKVQVWRNDAVENENDKSDYWYPKTIIREGCYGADCVRAIEFDDDMNKIVISYSCRCEELENVKVFEKIDDFCCLKTFKLARLANFTSDGKIVVGVLGGDIEIWEQDDFRNWEKIAVFGRHCNLEGSIEFSPDESKMITVNLEGVAKIWDLSFLNQPLSFEQMLFVMLASKKSSLLASEAGVTKALLYNAWQSFPSQVKIHLRDKFGPIVCDNFDLNERL